jgi:hypothetical protein
MPTRPPKCNARFSFENRRKASGKGDKKTTTQTGWWPLPRRAMTTKRASPGSCDVVSGLFPATMVDKIIKNGLFIKLDQCQIHSNP